MTHRMPTRMLLSVAMLMAAACEDYRWSKRKADIAKSEGDQRWLERVRTMPSYAPGALASAREAQRVGGSVNRAVGAALSRSEAPFVLTKGYMVRGTDEQSFVICGSRTVHYARLSPLVAQRVIQFYRFRAPKLLAPVYFEVRGRVVPDTVTLGQNAYTSVFEISAVDLSTMGEPACAPPPTGSLISANRF